MEAARGGVRGVLRRLMAVYDLTNADIAPVIGVTPQAVSARLRGKTVIKSEEIPALAVRFGVPVEVFYLSPEEALRWVLDNGPPISSRTDATRVPALASAS